MTLGIKRHGQKYELPLLDWIKYNWWKLLLFFKRTWRRTKRILSYSRVTIFVVYLWVFFLFLYCIFLKENILCEIEEARYEIFTSVILVWFIELIDKIKQYKNLLRVLYHKHMELEGVAVDLIQTITGNTDENDVLYSVEKLDLFFVKNDGPWKIDKDTKLMLEASLENIDKILSDIKENCLKNPDGKYTNEIIDSIDFYANDSVYFRKMLKEDKIVTNNKLNRFAGYIFDIIDDISYPWRMDNETNEKMVKIISKNLCLNQSLYIYDEKLIERESLLQELEELYKHKKRKIYKVKPKQKAKVDIQQSLEIILNKKIF